MRFAKWEREIRQPLAGAAIRSVVQHWVLFVYPPKSGNDFIVFGSRLKRADSTPLSCELLKHVLLFTYPRVEELHIFHEAGTFCCNLAHGFRLLNYLEHDPEIIALF